MSQEKNQTIYDVKVGDYVICVKDIRDEYGEKILTEGLSYQVEDILDYLNGYTYLHPSPFLKIKSNFGKTIVMPYLVFSSLKKSEKTGIENKTGLESKPHLCCFDPHLEYEMGMGMRAGANKHGWNNHRNLTSDSAQQILDSLKRHLNAFLRGEEKDEETNTSHLACVGNNLNFLYRMTKQDGYEKVLENIYGENK